MLFISLPRRTQRKKKRFRYATRGFPPKIKARIEKVRAAQMRRIFEGFESTPSGGRLTKELDAIDAVVANAVRPSKKLMLGYLEKQLEYNTAVLAFTLKQPGIYRNTLRAMEREIAGIKAEINGWK